MLYKAFQDLKLSCLGMGNMRLPTLPDGHTVDKDKTRAMLEYAYHHGVNYFDTAYSYHGGQSEPVVGEILEQFPRDTWYIASKMPGHEINPHFNPKAIFEEQLRRCRVDYVDLYLLHNVCELSMPVYENDEFRILDYLLEQKAAGRIRHLGFSTHASVETLQDYLDRHPGVFEFVQIQLNYLDWDLQDAKAKYELLTERGLPIIVMEPCRGGKLASLPAEDEEKLRAFRPDASIASWAFRWLQSLPNVQVVLSGMTNMEQMQDNVRTFSGEAPLSDAELECLRGIAAKMMNLLPCTGCRYCCHSCPQELNIPELLSLYNDAALGATNTASMYVDSLPEDKQPKSCLACGNCKQVCPQGIDVPAILAKLAGILDKAPHWADISRERAKLHKN